MSGETVRGASIIIHFDSVRRIHSRNCVLDRPDVHVPNARRNGKTGRERSAGIR